MMRRAQNDIEIKIPSKYRSSLEKLAIIDNQTFDNLIDLIRNSPPTLHLEEVLASAYGQKIEVEEIAGLLDAILPLYHLRKHQNLSIEDLVEKVSSNFQISELDLEGIEYERLSDKQVFLFKERLSIFLEMSGSLEVVSSASALISEYDNIFLNSQIITDIRPVFKSEIQEGIGGILIVHILRVTYQTINGKKEFFVALDSEDLNNLIKQQEDALKKEEALKNFAAKADINHLDVNSSNRN